MINTALKDYGIVEASGPENNPEIMKYFREIGQDWVQGDETAWCSAFVNYCAKVNGYEYSGKLNARSWLGVGQPVDVFDIGDIVVLWRDHPYSWKGHVGFPLRKDGSLIWILGGNQSNMVQVSAYSVGRILGFRRLRKL